MVLILAPGLLRVFHVSSSRKPFGFFKQLLWHLKRGGQLFWTPSPAGLGSPVEGNTQFREKVTRMAVGDEETLLGFTQVDARLSHLWMSVQRTDLSSLMLPLIPTPGFPFECSCEVNLFWRWDSST